MSADGAPEGEHGSAIFGRRKRCFVYLKVGTTPEAKEDAATFLFAGKSRSVSLDYLQHAVRDENGRRRLSCHRQNSL